MIEGGTPVSTAGVFLSVKLKGDEITIHTILIVACLVVGFLLGRMGSKAYYDGSIFFGDDTECFKLSLNEDIERFTKGSTLLLRVEQNEERSNT